MYQQLVRPDTLFGHIFGDSDGFLVTFTGQQARLTRQDARENELTDTQQRSWPYPRKAEEAAEYLIDEAQLERDAYFGVHLFREAGNRLAANASPLVRCLWLDEDDGRFPEEGPEPTTVVYSSVSRRHLYWRLNRPVAIEWAVEMNRRLAVWSSGDSTKAGAASVLRAPGTANYKRLPQVDLVAGEITGAHDWDPEVLDQAVPIPAIPSQPAGTRTEPYDGPELELGEFLEGIEILGELIDGHGRKYAVVCPWIDEHTGGDRTGTRVGQRENGALWFHCDHAHCAGRGWKEFKKKILPGFRMKITRPGYTGNMEVRVNRG